MFFVQTIAGSTPYQTGAIRAKRKVDAITETQEVSKITHSHLEIGQEAKRNHATEIYQQLSTKNLPRRRMLFAKDLMSTPVISLNAESKISQAWNLICEKRFRHLPIVNNDQNLIGIISDRDLLKFMAKVEAKPNPDQKISTIMHKEVLSASPDTEIRQVAKVMFEEKIGSMPIINETSNLLGIITRSDVLRALLVHAPLELWS